MTPSLDTTRLWLRPVMAADGDDLHGLEQDPEVMRFLNGGAPTPRIPEAGPSSFLMPRGGEPGVWAGRDRAADAFVGWFSLRDGELGYRLRRAAWGRGYATEGAAALLAHGFEALGLARIRGQTMAVNAASRRVMERLGMRHVRTFHLDFADPLPGSEQGEVEYAITREEWVARRSP